VRHYHSASVQACREQGLPMSLLPVCGVFKDYFFS
jgi:hypothetical protein